MSLTAHLIALVAVAASPNAARNRTTITDTYRVTYKADRDVYCLRIFADPAPADPHPGTPPDPCRSRADWARDGVFITDPQRAIAPS